MITIELQAQNLDYNFRQEVQSDKINQYKSQL